MDVIKQDIDNYVTGCTWRFHGAYLAALRKHFFGLYRLEGTSIVKVYTLLFPETADTHCWGLDADESGELIATINVVGDKPAAIRISNGEKSPANEVWKPVVPAEEKTHVPICVSYHKHAIVAIYTDYIAYKTPVSKNMCFAYEVDWTRGAHVFLYRGSIVMVNEIQMSIRDMDIADEGKLCDELMRYANIVSLSDASDHPQRYLCEDNSGRMCICEPSEKLRELLDSYVV